jgi:hypothetical protein
MLLNKEITIGSKVKNIHNNKVCKIIKIKLDPVVGNIYTLSDGVKRSEEQMNKYWILAE